jgi:hypothetical protein
VRKGEPERAGSRRGQLTPPGLSVLDSAAGPPSVFGGGGGGGGGGGEAHLCLPILRPLGGLLARASRACALACARSRVGARVRAPASARRACPERAAASARAPVARRARRSKPGAAVRVRAGMCWCALCACAAGGCALARPCTARCCARTRGGCARTGLGALGHGGCARTGPGHLRARSDSDSRVDGAPGRLDSGTLDDESRAALIAGRRDLYHGRTTGLTRVDLGRWAGPAGGPVPPTPTLSRRASAA